MSEKSRFTEDGARFLPSRRGVSGQIGVRARWRQIAWLGEQQVWAREQRPYTRSKEYTADLLKYGEWEALLRQADRVGLPRQPPATWEPRRPFQFSP